MGKPDPPVLVQDVPKTGSLCYRPIILWVEH